MKSSHDILSGGFSSDIKDSSYVLIAGALLIGQAGVLWLLSLLDESDGDQFVKST